MKTVSPSIAGQLSGSTQERKDHGAGSAGITHRKAAQKQRKAVDVHGRAHGFRCGSAGLRASGRTAVAEGAGGQFVIVIPALDMVVAIAGADYTSIDWYNWLFDVTQDYLIPAAVAGAP